jgi:hypothetical protein
VWLDQIDALADVMVVRIYDEVEFHQSSDWVPLAEQRSSLHDLVLWSLAAVLCEA